MKIRLKLIRMENFMCYADKTVDFSGLTKIIAANGEGKSTIVTAYNWVLFGCDYDLKDNPVVRMNGVNDRDVAVTLTLDVDSKEVTLRKSQKRTYKKDGVSYSDDNSYYINDVPKNLKDFNVYFDVDMSLLKMCSNINAFLAQKSADMREFLFKLADGITDVDIAHSKAELAELAPLLEKYTVEELTAMNKATKAKVTKEVPVIDGQIKEKERDIQIKSEIDVAEFELQRTDLERRIAEIVSDQTEAEKNMEKFDRLRTDIFNLKLELSGVQMKANKELENKRSELRRQANEKKDILLNVISGISRVRSDIDDSKALIKRLETKRTALSEQWQIVNSEKFNELTTICPTCHRELPTEEIAKLREGFEKSKADRLAEITEEGMKCKAEIDSLKVHIAKQEECNKINTGTRQQTEADLKKLDEQILAIEPIADMSGNTEYRTIESKIKGKELQLQGESILSLPELKAKETTLRKELAECEKRIALSDTTADEIRLEELRADKMKLGQAKTDSEKILALLDELDKAKNETLSDEVNSHFGLVKWQLSELAKNGNYKSTCIPTIDGKSIMTTISNKGNRILGRIDICSSIQKISGINCPIWLDDTESLDSGNQSKVADMVDSQLIMLIVGDSKDLIVEG